MSKTTKLVTAQELKAAPLPAKTATYTVISHGFIIDEITSELEKAGFEIISEEYRANNNLEVARGSYIIRRSEDPNFSMCFNWVNSYDKSTKFQCSVGGYVWENYSYVIEKEDNTFIRKHTGGADELAKHTIADKIANAEKYYKSVLATKTAMENITVSRGQVAKILGDLYFNFDMISIEQLSGIKKEYMKPSYVYPTYSDSLWTIYCHILTIIRSSHPKTWLMQQGFIHNYLKLNYLGKPTSATATETLVAKESVLEEQLPGQTNLLDAIAEVEAEHVIQEEVTEVEDTNEADAIPSEISEALINAPEVDFETIDPSVVTWFDKVETVSEDDETQVTFKEVEEAKEIYETETKSDQITDIRIIAALQTEVNNIFGYSLGIEVYKADDSYSIITSDGQEVTVPISYVESLLS